MKKIIIGLILTIILSGCVVEQEPEMQDNCEPYKNTLQGIMSCKAALNTCVSTCANLDNAQQCLAICIVSFDSCWVQSAEFLK